MRFAAALICLTSGMLLLGCNDKPEPVKEQPPVTELTKKDIIVGKGETAEKGDTVLVHYRGWLNNGTTFDENKAPDTPFSFTVGVGQVIPGWDEGVAGMKVGGKRNLRIPWSMGYGEKGAAPKIPPKADLNFDVELVEVVKDLGADSIKVEVVKPGKGRAIKKGDNLTISYDIKTISGAPVDSSEDRGGPVKFTFGGGELSVPAIEAGMEGMKEGEVRKIFLSANLGMSSPEMQRGPGVQIATITLIKIG